MCFECGNLRGAQALGDLAGGQCYNLRRRQGGRLIRGQPFGELRCRERNDLTRLEHGEVHRQQRGNLCRREPLCNLPGGQRHRLISGERCHLRGGQCADLRRR